LSLLQAPCLLLVKPIYETGGKYGRGEGGTAEEGMDEKIGEGMLRIWPGALNSVILP